MPMDDASSVPDGQPGQDSNMPPMNDQPIDNVQEPPMDGPEGGDMPQDDMGMDNGMEDPGIGSEMPEESPEGDSGDSTIDIINKLSDTDREAVRAYAESMLSRSEGENGGDDLGGDKESEPMPPMAESVIFTKGQLSKIHENLMNMDKDDNKKNLIGAEKPNKKLSKKSPFNSPKFK